MASIGEVSGVWKLWQHSEDLEGRWRRGMDCTADTRCARLHCLVIGLLSRWKTDDHLFRWSDGQDLESGFRQTQAHSHDLSDWIPQSNDLLCWYLTPWIHCYRYLPWKSVTLVFQYVEPVYAQVGSQSVQSELITKQFWLLLLDFKVNQPPRKYVSTLEKLAKQVKSLSKSCSIPSCCSSQSS